MKLSKMFNSINKVFNSCTVIVPPEHRANWKVEPSKMNTCTTIVPKEHQANWNTTNMPTCGEALAGYTEEQVKERRKNGITGLEHPIHMLGFEIH